MGQSLGSSIITLFFLSIAVQFNHTCPITQIEENNPRHRPRKKETRKSRWKISGAVVIKMFK